MKLTQFTPDVNKNIINAKVQAVDSPAAYGSNQTGNSALNASLGAAMDMVQKQWTKDQNDRVFDALNDYNQQTNTALYDENTGLFNTMQGKNAEGLQQAFEEQESKIRQDVIKKYKLNSDYAMQTFRNQVEPALVSTKKTIDTQQRAQLEKYTTNQDALDFQNTTNLMINNPGDIPSLLGSYTQRAVARIAGMGGDESASQVFKQGQIDKAASTVLQTLLENNDYERGISSLAYFKTIGADGSVLNKFDNGFRKQKDVKIASSQVDQAVQNDSSVLYMTDDQLKEYYQKHYPVQAVEGGSDIGNKIVEFAKGNYTEGDQWIGEVTKDPTIQCDSWTADVYSRTGLFPDGRITRGSDFGSAYHKAGDGYEPKPGDFIDGAHHVGIYLGDGKYMARNSAGGIHVGSMEEFDNISGGIEGYGSVSEVAGGESTSPEVAQARQDAVMEEFINGIHKKKQAIDQENAQQMDTVRSTIIQMNQSGQSSQDIYNYLSNLKDMNPALSHYSPFMNLMMNYSRPERTTSSRSAEGSSGGKKVSTAGVRAIKALIGTELLSKQDLQDFIDDRNSKGEYISDSDVTSLQKRMEDYEGGTGDFAVKIETSKSEVAQEMGVDSKDISDMNYHMAESIARSWAVQFHTENGAWPSQIEIRNQMIQSLAMDQVGGTDYTSRAQERAANIDYIRRADGIDERDTMRELKFYDNGRVYKLTDLQVNAILEGRATRDEIEQWDSENTLG